MDIASCAELLLGGWCRGLRVLSEKVGAIPVLEPWPVFAVLAIGPIAALMVWTVSMIKRLSRRRAG